MQMIHSCVMCIKCTNNLDTEILNASLNRSIDSVIFHVSDQVRLITIDVESHRFYNVTRRVAGKIKGREE